MINKIIGAVAGLALVFAIIGLVGGHQSGHSVGGVSNYDTLAVTGLKVGSGCNDSFTTCTGTSIARINAGVCYLRPYATTIAASTTAKVDCQATILWNAGVAAPTALTGVTLNDNVVAELSTTTAGTVSDGLSIIGASASSTSGYIELYISNNTGGIYTWPSTSGLASGTASYIVTR